LHRPKLECGTLAHADELVQLQQMTVQPFARAGHRHTLQLLLLLAGRIHS
jgi:hypothetical protein